jgi:hypothetical protein
VDSVAERWQSDAGVQESDVVRGQSSKVKIRDIIYVRSKKSVANIREDND